MLIHVPCKAEAAAGLAVFVSASLPVASADRAGALAEDLSPVKVESGRVL